MKNKTFHLMFLAACLSSYELYAQGDFTIPEPSSHSSSVLPDGRLHVEFYNTEPSLSGGNLSGSQAPETDVVGTAGPDLGDLNGAAGSSAGEGGPAMHNVVGMQEGRRSVDLGQLFKSRKEKEEEFRKKQLEHAKNQAKHYAKEARKSIQSSLADGTAYIESSSWEHSLSSVEQQLAASRVAHEVVGGIEESLLQRLADSSNTQLTGPDVGGDEDVFLPESLLSFDATDAVREEYKEVLRYGQFVKDQVMIEPELQKQRLELLDTAKNTFLKSISAHSVHDYARANFYRELSKTLFDTTLSFMPGVGWAKDVYEAISGKNIYGEKLTVLERGFAIAGVFSGGVLSKFKKTPKALEKIQDLVEGTLDPLSSAINKVKESFIFAKAYLNASKAWTDSALFHVYVGEMKRHVSTGKLGLTSGLHSTTGFEIFTKKLAKDGRTFPVEDVTDFGTSVLKEKIKRQVLPNGVTRIQLPSESFSSAAKRKSARVAHRPDQKIQGVKTLWPKNYTFKKINKAALTVLKRNASLIGSQELFEDVVEGVRVTVRVNRYSKKIETAYPAWHQ